jgi:hypothetical protein
VPITAEKQPHVLRGDSESEACVPTLALVDEDEPYRAFTSELRDVFEATSMTDEVVERLMARLTPALQGALQDRAASDQRVTDAVDSLTAEVKELRDWKIAREATEEAHNVPGGLAAVRQDISDIKASLQHARTALVPHEGLAIKVEVLETWRTSLDSRAQLQGKYATWVAGIGASLVTALTIALLTWLTTPTLPLPPTP